MSFDIKTKKAVSTKTLELTDGSDDPLLDDKGKRLSITVYGPGSKEYQRAQARRTNKAIERIKRKGKADVTAEQSTRESAEFLAACTVSLNGFDYPTDPKTEGYEMFLALYEDTELGYIRDQVAEFIGDWSNFTPGSGTN